MTETIRLERRIEIRLMENHPKEAANALESLTKEETAALLAAVPREVAAGVLEHMVAFMAAPVIERLDDDLAREILSEMAPHISVHILRLIPAARRQALIDGLPATRRLSLATLLSYPENTAGALMDPDELVLPEDISVREARSRITEFPEHTHYNLYVLDRDQRLVGVLNQSELMAAEANQRLVEVMVPATLRLSGRADLPSVLEHPGWQRVSALPVADKEGRFIGVIRYRKLRGLEAARHKNHGRVPVSTARSLGELYATGLGALFEAFAAAVIGGAKPAERNQP